MGNDTRLTHMTEPLNPFHRKVAWWIVLIEGLIALGIGIFTLLQPAVAAASMVLILGFYMLINSVLHIFRAARGRSMQELLVYDAIDGGIGLLGGLLVVLESRLPGFEVVTSSVILIFALVFLALIGLLKLLRDWRSGLKWGGLALIVMQLAFAGLMFYAIRGGGEATSAVVSSFGWLFIVIGVLMVLYGIVLYRENRGVEKAAEIEDASAVKSA